MSIAEKLTTVGNNLELLANQKNTLIELLNDCDIEASEDEKLNTIIPKIEAILKAGYELEKFCSNNFTNYSYYYQLFNKRGVYPTACSAPAFTSRATDFTGMFIDQKSLTEVPVFDTSNATTFKHMFYNCTALKNAPILNTSKVESFYGVFSGCSKLTSIPEWDFSNGTDFTTAFKSCSTLTEVSGLDMSNAEICTQIFDSCSKLTSVSLLNFRPVNLGTAFSGCTKLTQLPQIDCSRVNNLSSAFYNCSSLTNIPDLNIPAGAVDFNQTFYGCSALKELLWLPDHDGYFNAYNSAFRNCTNLKSLGTIYFHENTSFSSTTLQNCTSLETIIFEGTICKSGFSVQTATALSHETLMSIVNRLADYSQDTSGTTYKATFGATNLAKLTEEEKAIMDNKGWTYA